MLVCVITMIGLSLALTAAPILMLTSLHLHSMNRNELYFVVSIGVLAVTAWAVTIPSLMYYWGTIA